MAVPSPRGSPLLRGVDTNVHTADLLTNSKDLDAQALQPQRRLLSIILGLAIRDEDADLQSHEPQPHGPTASLWDVPNATPHPIPLGPQAGAVWDQRSCQRRSAAQRQSVCCRPCSSAAGWPSGCLCHWCAGRSQTPPWGHRDTWGHIIFQPHGPIAPHAHHWGSPWIVAVLHHGEAHRLLAHHMHKG